MDAGVHIRTQDMIRVTKSEEGERTILTLDGKLESNHR